MEIAIPLSSTLVRNDIASLYRTSPMIDHVSIAVSDLETSTAFYDAVLSPLGYTRMVNRPMTVGYGKKYPEFWLNARPQRRNEDADTGHHICLRAPDQAAVDRFYHEALSKGGRDDGTPGMRQAAMTDYYGAFIRDLDGNKIEAITFLSG